MSRLLADIGGTHARFAWQAGPGRPIGSQLTLRCADHPSLQAAIIQALQALGQARVEACALAIATPITGDTVAMVNHHWSFSVHDLREHLGQHLGLRRLKVLNDFAALAWALPYLGPEQLRPLGGGPPRAGHPLGLIGPGTGLGVAALVPHSHGGWVALASEGGHVTLGGSTARESAVLGVLQTRHGHVSAERALSGPGLVNLYTALRELDGQPPAAQPPSAADITVWAQTGQDPWSGEALQMFCALLGVAAGNLALTLGARGGIYLGGGIVPRLGALLQGSAFRTRFEAKGRMAAYLQNIPVYAICSPTSPALLGAAQALDADG